MVIIKKTYTELPEEIKLNSSKLNVFLGEEYNYYLMKTGAQVWYAYDDSYIIPVNIYAKMIFRYAVFMSEVIHYKSQDSIRHIKYFLEEIIKKLRKEKIAWISTSATAIFNYYPENSLKIPFGSHVIDLSLSVEELWKNVHTKHRNSIRRAEKNGIIIRTGRAELIDDYTKLDNETWKRSNKNGYGRLFFESIIEGLKRDALFVIAYKGDIPQAGACFFVNSYMAYYMYGASADSSELGAANYLHWEMIEKFKENGVQKYSFVGCRIKEDRESKYHGIQRFKERFGGELIQGYMFKLILNPEKYKLFRFLYKLKNKKELVDVIDEEIGKWKKC